MGSKRRISKFILPIILANRKENQFYVEPFCGGLNSLCNVSGARIAADINPFLIAMWKGLQNKEINFPTHIDKENYSYWRDFYHKHKDIKLTDNNLCDFAMCGWMGFMGSFNGRFFDGGYSGHNVNGRDYINEQIKNTISQVDSIKDVIFINSNFLDLEIPEKSIIYCDIPYQGTKQYDLSKNFNYADFYNWCFKMKENGHEIFISEYNMPNDFKCIWEMKTNVSLNQTKTIKVKEKLFTL